MKSFREYLRESYVTFEDALKLFGIRDSDDYKSLTTLELRNLYKKLAIANHPDKGGSVQMMQKINAAYDILQSNTGEVSKKDQELNRLEKAKLYAGISINSINTNFRPVVFCSYFEEIFGERFDYEFTTTNPNQINQWSSHVSAIARFFNEDKTTALSVSYTISFNQLYGSEVKLGASDGDDLSVYAHTEILYNRKKLTLIKNRYAYDTNYTIMRDPSKLFPRDKLVSQIKKTDNNKNKTLKKSDSILILQHELGAKISYRGTQIWADIPFELPTGSTAHLNIYRVTFGGMGTWQIVSGIEVTIPYDNLLGKKREKFIPDTGNGTLGETQEIFDFFVRGIKSIRGNSSTAEDVAKGIKKLVSDYKSKLSVGEFK